MHTKHAALCWKIFSKKSTILWSRIQIDNFTTNFSSSLYMKDIKQPTIIEMRGSLMILLMMVNKACGLKY